MLENSIQTSFDYLRKSGKKKRCYSKKTCKILQLLRKNQLFKCSRTSCAGATMPALEDRILTYHGNKPNEPKIPTSLSRLHHCMSLRKGQMLVKNDTYS